MLSFTRYCNVTELAAQSLYTLFMDDLQQFFKVYDAQPVSTRKTFNVHYIS